MRSDVTEYDVIAPVWVTTVVDLDDALSRYSLSCDHTTTTNITTTTKRLEAGML